MFKKIHFLLMACCLTLSAAAKTQLAAPVLNAATNVDATAFTASWTYNATQDVTYTLQVLNTYEGIEFEQEEITEKTCTATGLIMGHVYTFRVKAVPVDTINYEESEWSASKTVTLLTVPLMNVSPTSITLNAVENVEAHASFLVEGQNLTEDINITLNDESGYFRLGRYSVPAYSAGSGVGVNVYFKADVPGTYHATATVTSPEAGSIVVYINGTATIEKQVPVMQPATDVKTTAFRATWTDVPNVESYNLVVDMESDSHQLLLSEDFTGLERTTTVSIGNYMDNFLQNPGWTGKYVYLENGALRINDRTYYPGYITTPALDLTNSGGKVTVKINAKSYTTTDYNVYLTVKTDVDSKQINLTNDYSDYTVVVACNAATNQKITIEGRNANQKRALLQGVEIYNGDATGAATLRATEQGDSTQRIITGITDNTYMVRNLKRLGTFNFKVQPVYTDGTTGQFSNIEQVTLGGDDDTLKGDVNCDGDVNVNDVTVLVNYILGKNPSPFDSVAADVNEDTAINVNDVTALINLILGNH